MTYAPAKCITDLPAAAAVQSGGIDEFRDNGDPEGFRTSSADAAVGNSSTFTDTASTASALPVPATPPAQPQQQGVQQQGDTPSHQPLHEAPPELRLQTRLQPSQAVQRQQPPDIHGAAGMNTAADERKVRNQGGGGRPEPAPTCGRSCLRMECMSQGGREAPPFTTFSLHHHHQMLLRLLLLKFEVPRLP